MPGPLGVGKTTMQLQIIRDLIDEGVPPRHIIRVQFDEMDGTDEIENPILRITAWIEHNITPATFNALVNQGPTAYLFFDEAQRIHNLTVLAIGNYALPQVEASCCWRKTGIFTTDWPLSVATTTALP